jgi:ribosomal protein S18 acetylase RimI-like enzyme
MINAGANKMRDEMDIRLGTESDLDRLVEFNQRMAKETENKMLDEGAVRAGVRKLLTKNHSGYYLVAESGGEVVGSLMITKEWSDWRNGDFWWIQSVYIQPNARRRGVFRRLYYEVINRARESSSVRGIRLYTEKGNGIARETYRSLGMRETRYTLFEKEL